ncbi:MAG: DivIVA domain-containing protein, partial [Candidatus Woesearchaeota archaeon]
LDDIGRTYEKLIKEVNRLKDEKEKLEEKLKNYENIEDKLEQTLMSVQETAKIQTEQAKNEADMIIKKANMQAENIINEAKEKVRKQKQEYENIKEIKELFEIRFRSLLESHLEMLENEEQFNDIEDTIEYKQIEKEKHNPEFEKDLTNNE